MYINTPEKKIKRSLGILMLTVIGVSGTIGGSIFVLLSGGIELAGTYTPLAFVLGGVLALLGGLLYAEVGTTIPRPGADLVFVFNAFKSRFLPFLFSWLILLGDIGYLAINAIGFGFYFGLVTGLSPPLVALTALAIAALINIRGTQKTSKFEIYSLVILLLLFGLYGIYTMQSPASLEVSIADDVFRLSGVFAATALIFTSFVGYEYIATLSGEAKNARRDIPTAMVLTIVLSTIVFAAVAYFTLLGAPQEALAESKAPLLTVSERLGSIGNIIVIPAALLATGGSMIAAILITSRRLYAISHEGFFGARLAKLNKQEVPVHAIITCSVLASVLVLSQATNFVAYMSNAVYLIGFITIALSILLLRKSRPYLPRPFRAPLFPLVPFTVIGLSATLLFFIDPASILLVSIWLTIGWFAYLLSSINADRWRYIAHGAIAFAFLLLAVLFAVTYLIIEILLTQ